MSNTHELISSSDSYAGNTTLTFSSIPGTFTDLLLITSARGNGYNGIDLYMKFNNSSTSYSGKYMWKDGNVSSATSGSLGPTSLLAGIIPGTQAGSTTYGSMSIYIPGYSSNNYKTAIVETISERNGVDQWLFRSSNLWSNTEPITTITLTAAANFLGDSTAYLYGIKNN